MTEAIFRENQNIRPAKRSRFADLEPIDVGIAVGFLAFSTGLGMIWLPLAFVVGGGLVFGICLWRIIRRPRVIE